MAGGLKVLLWEVLLKTPLPTNCPQWGLKTAVFCLFYLVTFGQHKLMKPLAALAPLGMLGYRWANAMEWVEWVEWVELHKENRCK